MSGRSLHMRDGKLITNRKTDRRNPRLSIEHKRHAVLRSAPSGPGDVHMAFLLPKSLDGIVAPGERGLGVTVLASGFVRIASHSAEQCFLMAREFFWNVAKDRPAFTITASIMKSSDERSYGRYLTVIRGSLVVTAGWVDPKVYESAA